MPRGDNAGRPTELTKELFGKIKECIRNGNDLRKTAKVCGIVESTFYGWHSDNYLNLADKVEGWKRDHMLILAEGNLKEIMKMGTSDKETIKVVQDTSKFVAETLGKKAYGKNVDLTTGGNELPKPIIPLNDYVQGNNVNKKNKEAE